MGVTYSGVNRINLGNGSSADFNLDGVPDIAFSMDISGTANKQPSPVGIYTFNGQAGFKPFYLEIDGVRGQWPQVKFGMYTVLADINRDGIADIIPIDQSEVPQNSGQGPFVGNYAYAYISQSVGKYNKVPIGSDKFCVHGWAVIDSADGVFRIVFNTPWSWTTEHPTSIAISEFDTITKRFNTKLINFNDSFFGPEAPSWSTFFYLTGADVNRDGNTDLVAFADSWHDFNAIYLNDGAGNFSFSKQFSTGLTRGIVVEEATSGDFNRDGYVDLVVLGVNRIENTRTPEYKTLKVLINDQLGGFVDRTIEWLGAGYDNVNRSYGYLDTYDINADGANDFSWNAFNSTTTYQSNQYTMFVSDGSRFSELKVSSIGPRTIPLTKSSFYSGDAIVSFGDFIEKSPKSEKLPKATNGDDVLKGTINADVINGKKGNDTLTGLSGSDTFQFTTNLSASTNLDTITDFEPGIDRLQFSAKIFKGIKAANAAERFFTGSAELGNGAALIYRDGVLSYDSDGMGPRPALDFVRLTGAPQITVADIFVS